MSAPIKSKLSYAWGRLMRRGVIYSHTFEQFQKANPNNRFFSMPSTHFIWCEAMPIKGQKDQFLIKSYSYTEDHHVLDKNKYTEIKTPGIYMREQAVDMIKNWETQMLATPDTTPLIKSHFRGGIETEFVVDGQNHARSAIVPKKKAVAILVDEAEEFLRQAVVQSKSGFSGP